MVLGEFEEKTIDKMLSDFDLRDYYINQIKEKGLNESEGIIINLALEYILSALEENDVNEILFGLKESVVMQFLNCFKNEEFYNNLSDISLKNELDERLK